jgi:DNA-binding NtrC family response regulator
MPLQLQAKLLRVLEDGIVRPVGSDRASRIDARVIAASNSDLAAGVKKGSFREDLFYRLQVVPIAIAPLRERRSDIPLLVEYFLARMHARFVGRHWTVSQAAMVSLWSYDWPGNVRELENMIERLVIMCEGEVIDVALLPTSMVATTRASENHVPATLAEGGVNLNAIVRELEGRMINEALRQTGGNKQAAARLLGLKRTTFSAKLRRCGVIAPTGSGWNDES